MSVVDFLRVLLAAIGTSPSIMYITEVSRPELRGALISVGLTIANLGKEYTRCPTQVTL